MVLNSGGERFTGSTQHALGWELRALGCVTCGHPWPQIMVVCSMVNMCARNEQEHSQKAKHMSKDHETKFI
jgi:hypothetical protein